MIMKQFYNIIFLTFFLLANLMPVSERNFAEKHKKFPFPTSFSKPSQINFNYTPLVDFVGNWSNLILRDVKGINFTTVRLNSNRSIFGTPTFTLVGNGRFSFVLTDYGYNIELPCNKSLLFHWKDFGGTRYADHIGTSLGIILANGVGKSVYIAKRATGDYRNTSGALFLSASPMIELYKYWEKWGVEVATIMDYFETEKITLVSVNYLHQCQVDNSGPRVAEYTQPLLVDSLEREENSKGPFLGIQSGLDEHPEQSTQVNSTSYLNEEEPSTITNDYFLSGLILVTITAVFLMILSVYLFSRFTLNAKSDPNHLLGSPKVNTFSACLGLFSEEGLTVQLKSTNCPFDELNLLSMLSYVSVLHRQKESEEQLYGPFPVKQQSLVNFPQIERYFISFDFLVTDEKLQDLDIINRKGKTPAILLLFYPREFDVIMTYQKKEIIDLFKTIVPSLVHDFTPEVLNDLIKSLADILRTTN